MLSNSICGYDGTSIESLKKSLTRLLQIMVSNSPFTPIVGNSNNPFTRMMVDDSYQNH